MVKNRVAYSADIKNKAVEMKLQGYSTKQVMQELNIKNKTQVETWFRWYKNGETHRFHQQVGKQYSYEKGMAKLSEIDQLKLELRRKEVELEILKKLQGIGKEVSPQAVVKLVEELKGKYTVHLICFCLNVPISTYYRWKKKDFSPTVIEETIGKICKKNKFIYGYRKIKHLIQKELNQIVNHKVVQRIMQKNGWNCAVKTKKAIKIGKPFSITGNTLNRDFSADKPMQKLTTDITYLPFGPKRLYLSSIMDLYNGEILAYTIGSKQDTKFVLDTLNQIDLPKGVLLHSDQGSVYTSAEYYNLCKEKNIIRSMSRKGTPADNAPIESFHSSLKCEAFYIKDEVITSSSIVIQIVENYIKYYNENRIQQKLDYLSPVEYRRR
ncbi:MULTISPECIES: IS3 family transposase [unclassified Granulicatella]|uniref:IS3 family transposase n=2 Tax=Lactobacillales TaxID=186826 RepID=UPI00158B1BC1